LPMPEPMPRPTRLRFSDAFFGARIVDKFISNPVLSYQLSAISKSTRRSLMAES
jgi:hypothetical protein